MTELADMGRWSALVRAIELLRSARTIEDMVDTVRSCARRIADSEGVTVVLRRGDRVHYVAEDAVSPLWTGLDFPMGSCISGIAMLERRTIIIPDIYADPRVPHAAYSPTFVQSMAMFPVGGAEPMAAIGAYWDLAGEIDPESIKLMSALARSVSAALENIEVMRIVAEETRAIEIPARA